MLLAPASPAGSRIVNGVCPPDSSRLFVLGGEWGEKGAARGALWLDPWLPTEPTSQGLTGERVRSPANTGSAMATENEKY